MVNKKKSANHNYWYAINIANAYYYGITCVQSGLLQMHQSTSGALER